MAIEAHATARFVRTSAQKAGLVLDLIRGRDINHALATLRFDRHDYDLPPAAGAAAAAFSVFVVCPLNVRVGANSPSLWPTMFSVT